jgi:hypothetical protein
MPAGAWLSRPTNEITMLRREESPSKPESPNGQPPAPFVASNARAGSSSFALATGRKPLNGDSTLSEILKVTHSPE